MKPVKNRPSAPPFRSRPRSLRQAFPKRAPPTWRPKARPSTQPSTPAAWKPPTPSNTPLWAALNSNPSSNPRATAPARSPKAPAGVPLEVHLQEGLSASTTYDFRLVATHAGKEEATSEPVWFRTQNPSGSFAMLDARAWEMVSPADKHGAPISPNFISSGAITQAAAAGGAFTYLADAPTEAKPAGYTATLQVMSKRGPQGWESQDIATPHATPTGASVPSGYVAFDEGLSSSILQPEVRLNRRSRRRPPNRRRLCATTKRGGIRRW